MNELVIKIKNGVRYTLGRLNGSPFMEISWMQNGLEQNNTITHQPILTVILRHLLNGHSSELTQETKDRICDFMRQLNED